MSYIHYKLIFTLREICSERKRTEIFLSPQISSSEGADVMKPNFRKKGTNRNYVETRKTESLSHDEMMKPNV